MNKPIDMTEFLPKPAQKGSQPLNIALEGPPGGGKTGSALLLAQGIQDVRGGPIRLIDTEARRSTKYVGERIGDSRPFEFDITDLKPPFRADRFKHAILTAIETKPEPCCVIIDSASDEHEGIGGRIDWQADEVTRMLKRLGRDPEDEGEREKLSMAGWKKPSAARNDLARFVLQIHVPLIWTFRAEEKTKPVKNDRGKLAPTNIGFVPIAPVKLIWGMDVVCLLPPRADGVPMWKTDRFHEDFVLKLPEWFKALFAEPGPITPAHGRAMAMWAAGVQAADPVKHVPRETPDVSQAPPGATKSKLRVAAEAKAGESYKALVDWTGRLKSQSQQEAVADWWEDLLTLCPDAPEGEQP